MKKMTKKNNKGFSLVELIVVVLIMGIIAVALAPQVMKWVGTSRENSDKNTAKDIKSAIQIAIADFQGKGGKLDDHTTAFNINATDIASELDEVDTSSPAKKLADYVKEVLGEDYPNTSAGTGTYFKCTITKAGKVTVTADGAAPTTAPTPTP